jgi:hypothetical protein
VDGDILPDIAFTSANSLIGGLRTWPLIRTTHVYKNGGKNKLTNLLAGLRKIIKAQNNATTLTNNTIYSTILRKAKETGADHSIHGYYTATYKTGRDSLEVAWRVHVLRCSRKMDPHPHAQNLYPP